MPPAPQHHQQVQSGYIHPDAISLKAILNESTLNGTSPSIDLEWEPFQQRLETFLIAIDHYTVTAKTEIAARATDHAANIKDCKAEKEDIERRIHLEREREGQMLATLESERHTLTDLTSSVTHLQSSLNKVKDQSSSLESEINSLRKEVTTERTEKERQKHRLDEMRKRDDLELSELEEISGLRIDGIRENVLLMRFTLLDPSNPEREFAFLIDVSKQDYTVPNCDPPLPVLPELVRQLNQDRQFYMFIKRVRKAFRALIPNPAPATTKFDELSGPNLGIGLRTPAAPNNGSRVLSNITPALNHTAATNNGGVMDGSAIESLSLTNRIK